MTSITHQLTLQFYDVTAQIRSDSAAYIQQLKTMYGRFRPNGSAASDQPVVEYTILTQSDNAWGEPVMVLDSRVYPLKDPRLLAGHVYEAVLNDIVPRVRSHFLIHAGVVSFRGQGIILAADSFHGKTTLVLALLRRGFKFLSDDLAALGRTDRQVHPFPRSLRIRPGSLELAGGSPVAADAPVWLDKLLLDIEQIQPGSMGQPRPISHIFLLQNPAQKAEETPDHQPGREVTVLVDRLDETLLTEIRHIEGLTSLKTGIEAGYPALQLRARQRAAALTQIQALCQARGILILDMIKREGVQPDFNQPAQIETVSNSQAVMALLRHFQGGHQSALLQDAFEGSSTGLYLELATLIEQARCYKLYVGSLNQMINLVCNMVEKQ